MNRNLRDGQCSENKHAQAKFHSRDQRGCLSGACGRRFTMSDSPARSTLTTIRSRNCRVAKTLASPGVLAGIVSIDPSTKVTLKIISWSSRYTDLPRRAAPERDPPVDHRSGSAADEEGHRQRGSALLHRE